MKENMKNLVMTLLQNYRATKRKIEQLRYELEHPAKVSPDEMIEAMNFTKGDGEGRPSGSVSNKTLYIAMNFQSAADEANAALREEPIKWIKLQLASGATLFLRNTTVLDLSLLLNKMIG